MVSSSALPASLPDRRDGAVDRLVAEILGEFPARWGATLFVASLGRSLRHAEALVACAARLAEHTAESVLLVDGQLDDKYLSLHFGMAHQPGLTELVNLRTAATDLIRNTGCAGLGVLGAGRGMLDSSNFDRPLIVTLLDQLHHTYRFVVWLGDPRTPFAPWLARHADGTYLALELGAVSGDDARTTLVLLQTSGARVLGCITM